MQVSWGVFTSDERRNEEIDTQIGQANWVLRELYMALYWPNGSFQTPQSCQVLNLVFVPILTYGHEPWVITKRILSQVQAKKMGILWRFNSVTLCGKKHSCGTRKVLNVNYFRIKRYQRRWFGHVSRTPQEKLASQVLLATPTEKRPKGWPRTRWSDCIPGLAWNCSYYSKYSRFLAWNLCRERSWDMA